MTESRFYQCADIMEICGCTSYMAYKFIREWNAELRSQGYTTIAGKVVKQFADYKLGFKIKELAK